MNDEARERNLQDFMLAIGDGRSLSTLRLTNKTNLIRFDLYGGLLAVAGSLWN